MSAYRQLAFWLRDNASFINEDADDDDYYVTHYTEHNRSIWCEEDKTYCRIYEHTKTLDVRAIPVVELHMTNVYKSSWYPNSKPFGGMIFLKIKRVL